MIFRLKTNIITHFPGEDIIRNDIMLFILTLCYLKCYNNDCMKILKRYNLKSDW